MNDPDGLPYFEKGGIPYRWMPQGVKPGPGEFVVAFIERINDTGKEYRGRLLIPNGDGHTARRLLASFSAIRENVWYRLEDTADGRA